MPELSLFLPPELDPLPVCTPGPDGRCALCADEGLPGQVLELRPDNLGWVQLAAGPQEVALDLLEQVQVGDWVLVHLGVAIARLEAQP
jgi:hydrogenase assembly chaperone HypC/HupF